MNKRGRTAWFSLFYLDLDYIVLYSLAKVLLGPYYLRFLSVICQHKESVILTKILSKPIGEQ